MAKPIEQVTITGSVDKVFVATYKTIVKNKPRVLYEAATAADAVSARAIVVDRLKSQGIAFQILKVEVFDSEA